MSSREFDYFINHPIFVKVKSRWNMWRFKRVQYLKTVAINERIVEIPLALRWANALPEQAKVLDIGCAESSLPLFFASLGYKVVGCDYRYYPYRHPNLQFVRGDIFQLPFADEQFAAVLCISTLEHVGMGFYSDPLLADRPDKTAILEMFRVLQRGGLFILSVPFGVEEPNSQQRVYDVDTLARLMQNFNVDEMRFFKAGGEGRICGSSWVEIDQSQAEQITSNAASRCICMLRAHK